MAKVVLKDGTIFEITTEQHDRLTTMILVTDTLERQVKLGTHIFKLSDIEADPQKIVELSQAKMFDIAPVAVKKHRNMG